MEQKLEKLISLDHERRAHATLWPTMDSRVYFTLFVTILAVALGASMVIPLLPVYAQDLGATGFELGLIFSGFALARSILLPLVGSLADRWGRRGFIMAGLLIYSGVAIGFDHSQSVTLLILCRLTQGVGAAMVIP
ncbi:MAG: MFS transporter, partial [Thermodesulfobacteriota bacterium]|nr:MFS transporter [Thermodesulfobacteriota bacterium]